MLSFSDVLTRSLGLSDTGAHAEALALLHVAVEEAAQRGDVGCEVSLARAAGIISERAGDLRGALQYYNRSLRSHRHDPYLHWIVARLLWTLGEQESANIHFDASRRQAVLLGDSVLVDVLDKFRSAHGVP